VHFYESRKSERRDKRTGERKKMGRNKVWKNVQIFQADLATHALIGKWFS